MAHWDFLSEKLGSDVVKYIIQPMLLPSKEDVIDAKDDVIDRLTKYNVCEWRETALKPSQIYLREFKQRCSGCGQKLWADEMTTCDICNAYVCDGEVPELGLGCDASIGHWNECLSCAGFVKVDGKWVKRKSPASVVL